MARELEWMGFGTVRVGAEEVVEKALVAESLREAPVFINGKS